MTQQLITLKKPAAILFDLDGTLVDTAQDLGVALNFVLRQHCLLYTSDAADE